MPAIPEGTANALLAALGDPMPEVRAAAAARIGELWSEGDRVLPPTPELMAELARRDAENPGVADAFWTIVVYDFRTFASDFDEPRIKAWMLGILYARRERRRELSPVPGNDLEFYAHETFDDDFEALTALLTWGYVDVVAMALDHPDTLRREHTISLMNALYAEHGKREYGAALAIAFGVLRDDAAAEWPLLQLEGTRAARMLTLDYAFQRLWTVHWLFPHPAPLVMSLETPEAVIQALEDAGVPLVDAEAELDVSAIEHIAFPDVLGTTRRSYRPRRDLALDLAVHDATGAVAALRVVQARRPLERV